MAIVMPLTAFLVKKIPTKKLYIAGITCMVLNPFAGRIYDKIGIKKLFVIGSICLLISNIGMYFVTMTMPLFIAAVFVGIMSAVAVASSMTYGASASMHGLNVAFLSMSICTCILVAISVFGVKEKQKFDKYNAPFFLLNQKSEI